MAASRPLDRVLAHVTADEVTDLTRQLVRIPSVYRPGEAGANEAAVAAAVAAWLRAEGIGVQIEEVAPGRPNVLGILEGRTTGRTLCLEGHTDVVTEGDPRAWRHPPFDAVLADGRIYGRGAADMKGGLAGALVAAAALRRSGVAFAGRLVVAALVDEEAGMIGARHFVRTPLGRSVDAAIICEPEENELCLEQKGVFWARVRLRGRMAHGAMPYAGVNPIAVVGELLAALPRLERQVARGVPRSRVLGRPHVTATSVRSPTAGVAQNNVIPADAECLLDIRLVPGLTPEAVLQALRATAAGLAARRPGATIEIEVVEPPRPATRVAVTEPVVRALAWAIRRATGRRPRFGGVPGSTDGTIFQAEAGIPIVTCGPGLREIPHQVDEYVEVRELLDASRSYAGAALRYLAPARP
jgi:succinyl-diaminopimelate desuccinylase